MNPNAEDDKRILFEGFESEKLFERTLDAIKSGVSAEELEKNPRKYLLSGETKLIVVNTGGEGLKVSREIIAEMAARGDKLAKFFLELDEFQSIGRSTDDDKEWLWFEIVPYQKASELFAKKDGYSYGYQRENPTLIEILKENVIKNIGGWTLELFRVPVEPFAYKIRNENDHWRSEYVLGGVREPIDEPIDEPDDEPTDGPINEPADGPTD